ncbi:transcriptional regulator, AsnC family [Arboricoccus pini]|uniref:Transcriptional regulator, AsnC family n=1 Tax=Arboricoccus pini TaxID=1963835 RepID=A0A212RC92_9PROT|nr:Lrp/AsnC ligand binding domain-containing protein [Arboricoccus pini]SNB69894.1 transcriptional regulator, AsnC family [Arboricoccus pini]
MRTIFVQVKCALGRAYATAEQAIESIEEASEVYSTSGEFDLIMKFHLADDVDIGRFVTSRVQTLDGVRETFTLIAFKAFA